MPEIPSADVTLITVIGKGGCGKVWAGSWLGTPVAVKVNKSREWSVLQHEVQVLTKLRHPYVCSFFGTTTLEGCPAVLLELMDCCLKQLLHERNNRQERLTLEQRTRIAHETASGLAYLHRNHYIHRDVKPANVLLDEMRHAKVADFGTCAQERLHDQLLKLTAGNDSATYDRHTCGVGTPRYMAPEVLFGLQPKQPHFAATDDSSTTEYNESCDVYSFGLLLWELMHEAVPFADYDAMHVALVLSPSGQRPQLNLPAGCGGFADIITACWHCEPAKRPTMTVCANTLASQ